MDKTLRNRFMPKIQSITLISSKEKSVNPSRSSSIEQKKLRFNQYISYYQTQDDHSSNISKNYVSKQEMESFDYLQKNAKFIEYSDYNIICVGQQIIAISYFYPEDYPEQMKEKFDQRLEETKLTIKRRFPFIQLLLKPMENSAETSYGREKPNKPFFEVQTCSYITNQGIQKSILSSMALTGQLPKVSSITNNLQRTLRNVDLVVQLDCFLKNAQLIGPNKQNLSLLEGLQVSLKQKTDEVLPASIYKDGKLNTSKILDECGSSQFLSKINIPSGDNLSLNNSLCRSSRSISQKHQNLSQSRSTKSITFSQRSSKLISQTSIFLATKSSSKYDTRSAKSIQNESMISQAILSPTEKFTSPLKKNQPIKVFSLKAQTNKSGTAYLKNIPLDVEDYLLEVSGSRELKYFKQQINLKSLYEQQNDGILTVYYDLEREDLCQGNIKVNQNKTLIKDAIIKIGNYEFWNQSSLQEQNKNLWYQQIEGDNNSNSYSFYSLPGSYFIEISKEGCYTERKQVHFKRGTFDLTVNLVQSTLVKLTLKTKSLITQELVGDFMLKVVDEQNNVLWNQKTDETGVTIIQISLMKKVRVYVQKENFVSVFQDIYLSAEMLDHDIFVIPQNENVKNRLDILIHEPHNEFNLNYQLVCPGFNPVNQHNTSNVVYGASYDFIKFKNGGRLVGISVQQLNGKNFEIEAFSILQKPNVKEQLSKQAPIQQKNSNEAPSDSKNNENDFTFLDLYSRTVCYPESTKQQKYEEHQKIGRNFCKAVQSVNGYFYSQRLATTPLQYQKNLKEYVYVNEQLAKYTPEKSARVYVIYNNTLLDISYINQNIFVQKKQIGYFDFAKKIYVDSLQSQVSQPYKCQSNQVLLEKKSNVQQFNSSESSAKNNIARPFQIDKIALKDSREAKFYTPVNKNQSRQQQSVFNKRY
ncbi:hypothetical protein ABPG74_016452 [Tetrahymena malaccensis]